jgi:hypothetical protein
MMSDPPPGGNGTISRTGRVGQLCAVALTFPKARKTKSALLGPREMSDLSPKSDPKRTLSRHRRMTDSDPG